MRVLICAGVPKRTHTHTRKRCLWCISKLTQDAFQFATDNGNNEVSFNEIYDIGKRDLSDMGCVRLEQAV